MESGGARLAFTAASVPAVLVDSSQGTGTYLFPALAAVCAIPLLRLALPSGVVTTAVALGVPVWGLVAHLASPHLYDEASTTTYVVLGTMLSFAAVVLLSQHQAILLRPLRRWIGRPSESGLALRLAVAYPTARRFRTLTDELETQLLSNGAVATDIRQAVHDSYSANTQFFQLMQGYRALGLFVGITGLGVVMVRAVRERRRTIGVLRALGFRARTIRRAFLAESTFVALEGVVVGSVLGVLTTYLLYRNSPMFGTVAE